MGRSIVSASFGQTPRHAAGKVRLKIRSPTADGLARVSIFCMDVAIPAIWRFSIFAAPTRLGGILRIVAAQREEEEPRWRVAFLEAAVRIGIGPGFERIQ